MAVWQRPRLLEELAMNAEVGAYQPEEGDGERRDDEPFVRPLSTETMDEGRTATSGG